MEVGALDDHPDLIARWKGIKAMKRSPDSVAAVYALIQDVPREVLAWSVSARQLAADLKSNDARSPLSRQRLLIQRLFDHIRAAGGRVDQSDEQIGLDLLDALRMAIYALSRGHFQCLDSSLKEALGELLGSLDEGAFIFEPCSLMSELLWV